jgi:hypothetical protein
MPAPSGLNSYSIGVYDYNGTFGAQTDISYDVWFVDWGPSYTPGTIATMCETSRANNGRWPIISIQPQLDPKITTGYQPGYTVFLDDVTAGKYDANIQAIAADLNSYGGPVVLRWGHEMDLQSNLTNVTRGIYPWVVPINKASHYVDAYNRWANVCKLYTHKLTERYFLWSPDAGQPCMPYYPTPLTTTPFPNNLASASDYASGPGDNVDFVGMSLYSYPAWDIDYYGFVRSWQQIYQQKFSNIFLAQKPIIIPEMGCAVGDYQTEWTQTALSVAYDFASLPNPYSSSQLIAMCWFNAPTNDIWGYNLPAPDFSISPSLWNTG